MLKPTGQGGASTEVCEELTYGEIQPHEFERLLANHGPPQPPPAPPALASKQQLQQPFQPELPWSFFDLGCGSGKPSPLTELGQRQFGFRIRFVWRFLVEQIDSPVLGGVRRQVCNASGSVAAVRGCPRD